MIDDAIVCYLFLSDFSQNISDVVNATDNCDMPFRDDIRYLHLPLDDHPGADMEQCACELVVGVIAIYRRIDCEFTQKSCCF